VFGYLDCSSGVSGDKFLGALVDAGLPADVLRDRLAGLGLSGWSLATEETARRGLRATLVSVRATEPQPARSWGDIEQLIGTATLSERARDGALNAFRTLADAEARVHGVDAADVHFHEVGAIDSIIDVVGVAVGIDELGIDEMWSSPVCVGSGTVESAHGRLPVPAPAAAELLVGVPAYAGPVEAEMTTPTGAALLRAFVTRYASAPLAEAVRVGYGAGQRDPSIPNVLRLTLYDRSAAEGLDEQVALLETVVDHLAPEHLAGALELVLEAGALDVWQAPVVMKKGRIGSAVTVLSTPQDAARLTGEIMRQTGTLGVRRTLTWRSIAPREHGTAATAFGEVRVKSGGAPGSTTARPEADDVVRIARDTGRGVAEVADELARDASGAPDAQSTME
jgi:uncharacterized protein (TIGR00299 family) protein